MATIKAKSGVLLTRPAGGVLATSCGQQPCSPCITTPQNAAAVELTGGPCQDFYVCGAVDLMPASLPFCEAWQGPTWAGDCCWLWLDFVDISEWTAPGWVFNYLLVVSYQPPSVEHPAGRFTGAIYCGSDVERPDPCQDWSVGTDPLFVSTDDPRDTLHCDPADNRLRGLLHLQGRDSGWGGADATGYTATITLP